MTSYVTPKKNTAYKFYVGLIDQSNTKLLKANPTIASGDFKVSTDGGAFANLATLPSANPASGRAIMIDLSSGEMNGDNVVVQCVDAAGAEWCDLLINIQTSARQVDDLAWPATTGRSMVVDASGLVDATAVKVGPSGSATAQTARDVGASVLLSNGTGTGQLKLASGYVAMTWADIAAPTTSVNLSGTTIGTVTNQLTAAAIATGIWQDATAGDFTAANSIGKSIMNGVSLGTGLTIVSVSGAVGSVTGAVGSVAGAVGSVTASVTVGTNNDKTGYALSATGSAALTEGYAADGAAPTLAQILHMIWSFLAEKNVSGTTLTAKKLDGSTSAMTFTLDSATAPTSITRAS